MEEEATQCVPLSPHPRLCLFLPLPFCGTSRNGTWVQALSPASAESRGDCEAHLPCGVCRKDAARQLAWLRLPSGAVSGSSPAPRLFLCSSH